MCAQPFGWRTFIEVAKTLLLPKEDFKGEAGKRGGREARRKKER